MPGARLTEAYICGDNGVIDSTTQRNSKSNNRSTMDGLCAAKYWLLCMREIDEFCSEIRNCKLNVSKE